MADLGEIFSRTSDAVFAIDDSCRIVYRNEIFSRLFPCSTSGGADRHCYEVVCGKTLDGRVFCNPDCPAGKSLASGRPVENFDLLVPGANGNAMWVNVGSFPLSKTTDRAVAVCLVRPVNAVSALSRPSRADGLAQNGTHKLTPRERQILRLLAEGHGTRKLAGVLHISHVTARNHIHNILKNSASTAGRKRSPSPIATASCSRA